MTELRSKHEELNAKFTSRANSSYPLHYGRPLRTVQAIRNGVGLIEMPYDILRIHGDDRIEYVDNIISNTVPHEDGEGCYAFLLDPEGKIRIDMYVYSTSDQLLLFCPPGTADEIAEEWNDKTFLQDVTVADKSNEFAIFGVHGPQATEKLASVLNQAAAPEESLTFNRGKISDNGVTVIRNDGLVGEEGYEIVCQHSHTATVFDTLLNHGLNAVPFGLETWNILTLEAGTPLYETELRDRIPLLVGTRNALDLEKGCFVGQEVVSRIENRGQIRERLIGLELESSVSESATVMIDGNDVGNITRVKESPTCNSPIAFALCKMTEINGEITVSEDNISTSAKQRTFPFVTGSDTSARIPRY